MPSVILAIIVSAAAIFGPTPPAAKAAEPAAAEACAHYQNRARFNPRNGAVEFTTVLADACAAIERERSAASADRRAATAVYLSRLSEARAAIDAINRDRLAARERRPERSGPNSRSLRQALRLVSPSGEFLILRKAGVFAALRQWSDAGRPFALLAALP